MRLWARDRASPCDDWKTLCQSRSKWVFVSNKGSLRQRKVRDGLRLSSAVPKIQWDTNPHCPTAIELWEISTFLPAYLSICLYCQPIYLSRFLPAYHLSVHTFAGLSAYLLICLYLCLPTCLEIYLSKFCLPTYCLSIFLPACLSVYLSICIYFCLPACLPIYLAIFLPAYITICLYFCLPNCLPICLSICLPAWLFISLYFASLSADLSV